MQPLLNNISSISSEFPKNNLHGVILHSIVKSGGASSVGFSAQGVDFSDSKLVGQAYFWRHGSIIIYWNSTQPRKVYISSNNFC